jgi:hypothetical protein
MAATDARPIPRKNVAYRLYFAIRKNDGTLITSWTGADTELSADGAAFADATNEATEIGTSGCGYLDLTSGEMNVDNLIVKTTVTNTDALTVVTMLYPMESADAVPANLVQVDGTVNASATLTLTAIAAPITGNITGNLSGSVGSVTGAVGSVTGAVGSVTGNVGGNVTGSVGSVVGAVGSVTGDIGGLAAGAITDVADAVWDAVSADHVDAGSTGEVLSNAGGGSTPATIAAAVWDEALAGHAGVGSAGAALTAAGSAGDPWSTALPGAYGAGTAGELLGTTIPAAIATVDTVVDTTAVTVATNLNATISSRASQASVDTLAGYVDTEVTAIKARTDLIPDAPAAVGSAMTLTSGERLAVALALLTYTDGVEAGYTPQEALRIIAAATAGLVSGADVNEPVFRSIANNADRITATTDGFGNRLTVTLTP